MYHILATLGKKRWVQGVIPTALGAACFAHNFIEAKWGGQRLGPKYLSAEKEPGTPEEISSPLQDLIVLTIQDIRDVIAQPLLPRDIKSFNARWFLTKLPVPVTFGITEMPAGVTIGLPFYLNYNDQEHLPASSFKIENFSWLRRIWAHLQKAQPSELCVQIERHGDLGKELADCYILSDRAKKFVIAREAFYTDTYRHLSITIINLLTLYTGIVGSKYTIFKRDLIKAHVGRRLAIYFIASVATYLFNKLTRGIAAAEYIHSADLSAAKVNEEYYKGSIEYLEKMIRRREVVLNACVSARAFPWELVDKIPFLIPRQPTFETRLKRLRSSQEAQVVQ